MPKRAHYLIVDGHSIIFAWPELRKLHARRSSLAREALIKQLRDYQDWTGVSVVVVFDGKGKKNERDFRTWRSADFLFAERTTGRCDY